MTSASASPASTSPARRAERAAPRRAAHVAVLRHARTGRRRLRRCPATRRDRGRRAARPGLRASSTSTTKGSDLVVDLDQRARPRRRRPGSSRRPPRSAGRRSARPGSSTAPPAPVAQLRPAEQVVDHWTARTPGKRSAALVSMARHARVRAASSGRSRANSMPGQAHVGGVARGAGDLEAPVEARRGLADAPRACRSAGSGGGSSAPGRCARPRADRSPAMPERQLGR